MALLLRRLGAIPLLGAAAAIVLTVVFGELPGTGKYSAVLQGGCHAPAFAALALIMLTLLARRPSRAGTALRTAIMQAIAVIVVMLLLGAVTEILQGMLGRDEDLDDVISDGVGAGGAASLWLYATLRGIQSPAARLGRLASLLACAALLAFWAAPLVRCGLAYWTRDARFPVLAQFQSPRDLYFVSANPGPARIVPIQQSGVSSRALYVPLEGARWPGVTLTEPVPDWRAFHGFSLEISNPGAAALPLRLRISDRAHNGAFDDRFNMQVLLSPGERTVLDIPLERIAASPRTRRMDLAHMADIILFRDGGAAGEAVLVHRVWLR
jgi:hypothetical protein